MTRNLKRLFVHYFSVIILSFFSLSITLIFVLNSVELAFNNDIPYIPSLEPVKVSSILTESPESYFAATKTGNYGDPTQLKISSVEKRLELVEAIPDSNGNWLARSNTAHYAITSESKSGSVGDMVIYIRPSWRTVSHPENIKRGDNIFINTNKEWRYMFRVDEISQLQTSDNYIVSSDTNPRLLVVFYDKVTDKNIVISASYVTLQNTER
jgi:hypothetical protein